MNKKKILRLILGRTTAIRNSIMNKMFIFSSICSCNSLNPHSQTTHLLVLKLHAKGPYGVDRMPEYPNYNVAFAPILTPNRWKVLVLLAHQLSQTPVSLPDKFYS